MTENGTVECAGETARKRIDEIEKRLPLAGDNLRADLAYLIQWARTGASLSLEPRRGSDASVARAKVAYVEGGKSVEETGHPEPSDPLDAFLWTVGKAKQEQNVAMWEAHDAIPAELSPFEEGTLGQKSLKSRIFEVLTALGYRNG